MNVTNKQYKLLIKLFKDIGMLPKLYPISSISGNKNGNPDRPKFNIGYLHELLV